MNDDLETNTETEFVETPGEKAAATPAEPKVDGMKNRDALSQAITEHRQARDEPKAQPTQKQVAAAVDAEPNDPPAEFNAAEKKAWADRDLAGIQRGYKRVHEARTVALSKAQAAERTARAEAEAAKNEGKNWRELSTVGEDYIKQREKEGVVPHQAMKEVFDLIREFKKDPRGAKAQLKAMGIDMDAESTPGAATAPAAIDPALQTRLDRVEKFIGQQETEKVVSVFSQSIGTLAALKNRAGDPVYPGFHDGSEEGKQFAAELGSLTREPLFINLVRRRFPNATHADLVREAYIQLGGPVSGEVASVSPSNKQHVDKARRAAASTPGRPAQRNDSSNLVGKLSNRAALQRAIAESREN